MLSLARMGFSLDDMRRITYPEFVALCDLAAGQESRERVYGKPTQEQIDAAFFA